MIPVPEIEAEDSHLRYRSFARSEWADLRHHDEHILLDAHRIDVLKSIHDHLSNEDIEEVYLPLLRFIELHIEATRALVRATSKFLRVDSLRIPFVVGVAGSVAVGKSTAARVLEELLSHPRRGFKVALVTTDGFLLPTAELEARDLTQRKGFPESYDAKLLMEFLSALKGGEKQATAPVYSHVRYDRVPGEFVVVERPDILILEGLNILQGPPLDGRGADKRVVSDFIDLSLFMHAREDLLKGWYIHRFLTFRKTVFSKPDSHFRRYADLSDAEAVEKASTIWETINGRNLRENILPTRYRADVILNKTAGHRIDSVEIKNR